MNICQIVIFVVSRFNLCEPLKCFFLLCILPHFIMYVHDISEIKEYIERWERKRTKCFFTYIHLELFRSHPFLWIFDMSYIFIRIKCKYLPKIFECKGFHKKKSSTGTTKAKVKKWKLKTRFRGACPCDIIK